MGKTGGENVYWLILKKHIYSVSTYYYLNTEDENVLMLCPEDIRKVDRD